MNSGFTIYALEAMGFREVIDKGALAASFMSVTVYEAKGLSLPVGFAQARQARVAGTEYRIALSTEVNSGCQKLIGDDFFGPEADGLKEFKAMGPFVLIGAGPTDFTECEAGRMRREADGSITTYDCFPHVREIVKSLEERVLPPVLASLTLAFNAPGHYIALRKVTRASVGRSVDCSTIHDIRANLQAELTVSRGVDSDEASAALDASIKKAPKLNAKAATYFALGVSENVQLKRFLYFFLSLEIATHAVFKRIDHRAKVFSLVACTQSDQPMARTAELLASDVADWSNLFARFVWCANCVWTHLVNDDVILFKKLKSVRDAIAHGDVAEPPVGFAREAELLAHRVLWA